MWKMPTKTTATAEQFHNALRLAAPELSPAALLVLVSQTFGIETGGGTAMRNYNIGGVKHILGTEGDYTFFSTRDPAGPGDDTIVLHHAPSILRQQQITPKDATWSERCTCFAAFENLNAAAAHFVATLKRDFAIAWRALLDPPEGADLSRRYATALKSRYYFAAPLEDHTDPKTGKIVMGYASGLAWWLRKLEVQAHAWRADA